MRNSLNFITRTILQLSIRGRKHSRSLQLIALVLVALTVFGGYRLKATWAAGTISLTSLGTAYTQNFDTLSNTAGSTTNNLTIPGWDMTETGGGARDNEQYAVDTGASTTGDTYSYGSSGSTERALGQLRSGTLIPIFGASFTNNTGSTINSLAIAYAGEEWRLGTAGRTDQMNFEYSTNATDLVTGTWTNVAALNFVTPDTATVGAKNGNAAADRTSLSATITGLSIPNGATFWIRWNDTDATGADDGLAVDDFSLTPMGAVAQPNLTVNDVSLNEGNAGTTSFTFTVSLSAPAGAGGVTFDVATADGTATAPGDYTAKSLTSQTIPAGSSTYSFTVLVNGDTIPETNETFFVNVTNVTGANVTDGQGQGTIVNDDAAPNLTINDVSLNEGNSGTTTFTFTVSLSAPAGAGGVTFDIATADGTATAPGDYTAKSLLAQTIPAGSSTYTFDVLVNGDATVEPNEIFFVNVTNVTNAIALDTQGQGTIVNDDFSRIHDIQGSGTTSPLAGQSVTTQGIVTGIRSNGYFIQEPDASVDADPNTSEGIFVFTSSAPPAAAAVGNLVQVVGTVQEFIPSADPLSPPVTELSGSPTTALISTGNTLPTPITLTTADTGTGGTNSGSIENLEKYEGMRVAVGSLTAVAPTQGTVTESSATSVSNGVFYGVITGVARPFREPGIQANDPVPAGSGVSFPSVPRFDFNPERLRVDSDALTGAPALNVTSGAVITNIVGPLDYAFRTYTILPDPPSVTATPTVTGIVTFTPVPAPLSNEFTVASFNMERFFDTVDDAGISDVALTPTAFANRLNKASLAIRNVLNFPDILGVEEMENLTTLQAVATKINNDAVAASQPNPNYVAYLIEGNDIGGIDVGFLVKTSIVFGSTPRVFVCPTCVIQEGQATTYTNPNNGAQEILNDRPPLRLMAVVNHPDGRTFPITVIVVHQRSLSGIDDETVDGTGTAGGRVRAKRRAQAEFLANLIQARQAATPTERIICVGDYNGFEFNDGYVDIMGTVRGVPTPANQVVLASADLVNPNLTDLVSLAAVGQNYSYSFDGDAQAIDHELANSALMPFFSHINFGRTNADFPEIYRSDSTRPERLSDHDPGVAYFTFPAACPTITVSPSTIPTGTAGSAYGPVQFSQTGSVAAITWSVTSNNLPAGLTLNPTTGQLSGTPTVAAGVNVTIRATDANNCFGEVIVTLQISCPTITVSPSSGSPTVLTSGTVGQSYSQTFTAAPAGGGYTYAIPPAAIPPGLTFNTATGLLSGTPTTQGTFFFTVTATGFGTCTGSQNYSLKIDPGCPSSFTVNDLGDAPDQTPGDFLCQAASGACTLRAAIMEANALPACSPLTINFSVTGTINLATALPALNHPNLTINGPGANQLDVHRNAVAAFRIFAINSGKTVAISGLSVTNGNDPVQAGGIYNAGTLTLTACAISGNASPQGGGIQSDSILTMTGCTVSNNIASDFAGGLKIFGPTTTLTNCTFSNNQANDSSAIESNTGVTLTLTNCTIANNQAGSGAGQTGSALFANSGTVLKNTIVANNSGNNANIAGTVDTANSFNNLIGAVGTGGLTNGVNGNQVGVANANTLLAPLANYGGTTQTIALLPGSPAINAGTASGAPATDQRGIARVGNVDIGAFESRGFTLALAGGNNQSAFVNTAFANPLVVTVTNAFSEPVNGGKVTFTPPVSGASATIAGNPVTISGGTASGTATANGTVGGPYTVAASANGATPVINFSLTNTNPPPTITAAAALTRQQGTAASNSTVATVSDPNQTAGTLTVTATTVPAGLTVTNIVNTNGTVTANVAAACNATVGANTVVLTVTDSLNATATANLTINVQANTAPTLAYASPQSVVAGGSINVAVMTATDNGSITSYSVVSVVPPLTTAPTVNASGTVAITNALPTGSHVITVQATDNCGLTTNASFTLNVTCPTINATVTGGGAICPTVSSTLVVVNVTGGTAPYTVTLNNSGGTLTGASPLVFTVNPAATTTYSVQSATDANNCPATATGSATVTVNALTVIVTNPQPIQTVCAGQPVTFTVVASGTDLTYQWRKGGVPINGATASSFTIPSTVVGDAGSYDVVVTGYCGALTSNAAQLNVNAATAITTQPASLTRTVGQSATFSVAATGANLTYQWRKGSVNIGGATGSSFTINSVVLDDAGNYDVVVTGACGAVTSNVAALNVQLANAPPLTARIDDPLVCTGPGNLVNVTATVTNSNLTAQASSFTATLQPTLRALPGTCAVNVGTCSVVNPSTVTWTGTLAANQTVTINYQAQVNDGVPAGTQLCVTSVATVGNSAPATVTACGVVNCPAAGPGSLAATTSPISDQKPGSVLIFNVYTSSSNPIQQNTRVAITNTNQTLPAFVHLFLVDGTSCSVADSILCLTANQTTTFLASDLDPGTTGYIVAVAIDSNGCPTNFNYLIGDEYVKFSTGHAANLGAEAISAIAGGLPLCNNNSVTATLPFDGISYNVVPHVLAADNIPSRADGNDTLLILNRIGGNLGTGASTLGTVFGLFFDDQEAGVSFNFTSASCQFRSSITNNLPRITPRFEQFVPAGRSGWFKLWVPGLFGMTGAILNTNPNAGTSAGAFNQGHNLHVLTNTNTASYVIPIFPPGC